jgi:hypothetical protein
VNVYKIASQCTYYVLFYNYQRVRET